MNSTKIVMHKLLVAKLLLDIECRVTVVSMNLYSENLYLVTVESNLIPDCPGELNIVVNEEGIYFKQSTPLWDD